MKKILLWLGVILVVVLIVGVFAMALSINGAIKHGVETIGPRLTKTDVKLESVKLSLMSGSGTLNGFVIGNPEGFKTPQAISAGSTTIEIVPRSLLSDKIVVRKIEMIAPEITLEAGLGGINLNKILSNVQEAAGSGGTNAAPAPKEQPATDKGGKKFQVDDFLISKAKVRGGVTELGGHAAEMTIPDIHLTGLGTDPEGITAAELSRIALTAVVKEAVKVGTTDPALTKKLSEATGLSTNQVNQIGKGISDLLKKK